MKTDGRTDTTDCSTLPGNAVDNKYQLSQMDPHGAQPQAYRSVHIGGRSV